MERIEGCGSKADGSVASTSKKPRIAVQETEHDVSIMEMVRGHDSVKLIDSQFRNSGRRSNLSNRVWPLGLDPAAESEGGSGSWTRSRDPRHLHA